MKKQIITLLFFLGILITFSGCSYTKIDWNQQYREEVEKDVTTIKQCKEAGKDVYRAGSGDLYCEPAP